MEVPTDSFQGGSHNKIGNMGTHTLPGQDVSRKRAEANKVPVNLPRILMKKPRLMAPEIPKLPEFRGPDVYSLVNSSIKSFFLSHTKLQNCRLAKTFTITSNQDVLQTVKSCKAELVETPHYPRGAEANRKRNKEAAGQRSHQIGFSSTRKIFKQLPSDKEKRRGQPSCYRFEKSEWLCRKAAFQDRTSPL